MCNLTEMGDNPNIYVITNGEQVWQKVETKISMTLLSNETHI